MSLQPVLTLSQVGDEGAAVIGSDGAPLIGRHVVTIDGDQTTYLLDDFPLIGGNVVTLEGLRRTVTGRGQREGEPWPATVDPLESWGWWDEHDEWWHVTSIAEYDFGDCPTDIWGDVTDADSEAIV